MRFPLLGAVAALLLTSCGSAAPANPSMIPVSSVLDENARLRAENELLRAQPATDAGEEAIRVSVRDAQRKSNLQAFGTVAQLWAIDHGNHLPLVADDEFQTLMVSGNYLIRVAQPLTPGEHYCYAISRDRTEYSLSTWLEEDDRPYSVGSDLAVPFIAKSSRNAYFGGDCPRVPGWTSVRA